MSHWGFWEWVAYALIGIPAVVLAVRSALSENRIKIPALSFLRDPKWGYLPLVAFLVGSAILAGQELSKPKLPSTVHTTVVPEKIILDIEPAALIELVRDKTTLQVEQLQKIYTDKWIKISGVIENVDSDADVRIGIVKKEKMVVSGKTVVIDNPVSIWAQFDPKWKGQLALLARKEKILALCQIQKLKTGYRDVYDLTLKSCDLLP